MHHNSFIKEWLYALYNIVFPALCLECKEVLTLGEKIICNRCLKKLSPFLTKDYKNFLKRINQHHFDAILIIFEYSDLFQDLMHGLKYKGFTSLAKTFAQKAAASVTKEFDLICCVPLHNTKLRERGYNQSALIAFHLSTLCAIPFLETTLERVKDTVSQTKLSRAEREKNVEEAFTCVKNVKGKRILLIDDVITTGATLNSCSKVLKQAGASSVTLLALATPVDILKNEKE